MKKARIEQLLWCIRHSSGGIQDIKMYKVTKYFLSAIVEYLEIVCRIKIINKRRII